MSNQKLSGDLAADFPAFIAVSVPNDAGDELQDIATPIHDATTAQAMVWGPKTNPAPVNQTAGRRVEVVACFPRSQ
jgi:hypothetical protein